jgi:hypothetical protein
MSANQARSPSPRRRSVPVENEHLTFRRYNYQKLFSAGVDNVETTGRKIPGLGYVVEEIYQVENPFSFHPRRDCEDSRRYDK